MVIVEEGRGWSLSYIHFRKCCQRFDQEVYAFKLELGPHGPQHRSEVFDGVVEEDVSKGITDKGKMGNLQELLHLVPDMASTMILFCPVVCVALNGHQANCLVYIKSQVTTMDFTSYHQLFGQAWIGRFQDIQDGRDILWISLHFGVLQITFSNLPLGCPNKIRSLSPWLGIFGLVSYSPMPV